MITRKKSGDRQRHRIQTLIEDETYLWMLGQQGCQQFGISDFVRKLVERAKERDDEIRTMGEARP